MSSSKAVKIGSLKIGMAVLLVGGAVAFLIGPKPDKSPTTSAEAVATSGAATVQVFDPVHERPFDVSTWPAADGKNSLVVISHGFSGDRTSHDDLAVGLAAQGYTVAAPTHPDLAGLDSNDPLLDPLVLRPRHLSLTIDQMSAAASEPFDEVIVIGHSLGGYSALRVAGADPSGVGVEEYCQDNETDNVLCTSATRSRFDRLVIEEADFTDSRVGTVVLLAPGYGPLFSAVDLETVAADVMIVAASADEALPGGQVEDLVAAMPSGVESKTVDGGHFVFLRTCTAEEVSTLPEFCADADDVDREAVHADLLADLGLSRPLMPPSAARMAGWQPRRVNHTHEEQRSINV